MERDGNEKHLIIHGHFYQPPRENPWTERIDRQASAAPYHDWNERIAVECYHPNARSRRLDGYGRITGLVNNYEWISFNFGPTLFSWIEAHEPGLYAMILEADRASADRRSGHGNAIAQAYNHLIMPLATRRDQETQIRWGVYDFRRRFGREPEGIWLPETAINDETLAILIEFAFRFIILSPPQAERIRPIEGGSGWTDVQDGSIPTGRAYRCFGPRRRGRRSRRRFIDIFFYDAPISIDISFNHLLRNGDALADAIGTAFERGGGDLAVIATDGEVYGHHEPLADMALSYLIDRAAETHGFRMTNFGEYLDRTEPAWEVQLKSGPDGEGTAWSCAHGVGRWKEDCGCNVGAPPDHNQQWRSPLRVGLDALRDELSRIYESEVGALLTDPWKVRDDYIEVIEERTPERAEAFITARAGHPLSTVEQSRVLALLESQRNAMLMFTSCGWFFNDITGIETVQLLEYAARAIELAGDGHVQRIERTLLGHLGEARSNTSEYLTGADLYQSAEKHTAIDGRFLAAQHAITHHLFGPDAAALIFGHRFRRITEHAGSLGGIEAELCIIEMTSPFTLGHSAYEYLLIEEGNAEIQVHLEQREVDASAEPDGELLRLLGSGTPEALQAYARNHFTGKPFTLRNLFPEDRERALSCITARRIGELEASFRDQFEQDRNLLRLLKEAAIAPPPCLLEPARTVLSNRLQAELERWEGTLEPAGLDGIRSVMSESSRYGIPLDKAETARRFTRLFLERIMLLYRRLDAEVAGALTAFARLCNELGIKLAEHEIQNAIFSILRRRVAPALADGGESMGDETRRNIESFLELARRFNFNVDGYDERLP